MIIKPIVGVAKIALGAVVGLVEPIFGGLVSKQFDLNDKAYTAGRVMGNAFAAGIGVALTIAGAGIAAGGTGVSGGALAVPSVGVGLATAAVGFGLFGNSVIAAQRNMGQLVTATSEFSGISDSPIEFSENEGSQQVTGKDSWGNENTLQDHFDRHGGDFGLHTPEEYAQKANDFFNDKDSYQIKVDEDGVIRVYDPETNTFGSYNKDGTTKTFFKPTGGQEYFANQPGY